MYFSKTVTESGIGDIYLRKQAGIHNIRLSVHPRRGIVVTVPWFMRYEDGLEFVRERKEWILKTIERQKERIDKAREEGRGMPIIRNGVSIRTQHQEIIIRRSPQGTLFGFDESWEHPVGSYGKTASKRRGTINQTAKILTTEYGTLMEGSNTTGAIAITRITYPYEWGEKLEPGSVEERMATESIIKALRKEARQYLPERLATLAAQYGFKYEKLAIKNNLTNWGSCSSKGNINLNLHLIRLPFTLSDFIILHELCHLKYFNHGAGFHKLFTETCERHFSEMIGEGREYTDAANLEKAFSRMLRKYYLW